MNVTNRHLITFFIIRQAQAGESRKKSLAILFGCPLFQAGNSIVFLAFHRIAVWQFHPPGKRVQRRFMPAPAVTINALYSHVKVSVMRRVPEHNYHRRTLCPLPPAPYPLSSARTEGSHLNVHGYGLKDLLGIKHINWNIWIICTTPFITSWSLLSN